jgi:hypothetical protein
LERIVAHAQRHPTAVRRLVRAVAALLVLGLAVLGLPAPAWGAAIVTLDVVPASTVAGAVGNLTVSFTAPTTIPANGRIVVTLPAGYGLTSTSATSSSIDGALAASVSGQIVTLVRSGGTAVSGALGVVLTDVQNPRTAGNPGAVTITTQDAALTTLDSGTVDPAGDTITAGALSGAEVEPTSLVANALATVAAPVKVTFTTANPWPATGQLVVVFPAEYQTTGTPAVTSPDGSVTGTFTASAFTGHTVTITRVGGGLASGGPLTLGFNSIVRNPLTAGTTGSYTLTTLTAGGAATIDTVTVAGDTFTETPFTVAATVTMPGSGAAGATGNAVVAFTSGSNGVPATSGKVAVTFPAGFGVATTTATSVALGTLTVAVVGQTVTVSRTAGAAVTGAVAITLNGITNPNVTSTPTFSVFVQDSSGATMAGTSTAAGVPATMIGGPLTAATVTPTTLVVSQTGTVNVAFTLANPLPSGATIEVTLPSTPAPFTASFGAATAATALSIAGTVSTSVVGQVVTLTRTSGATVAAATPVTFTLTNVRNPTTTGLTGTFSIATRTSGGVLIDVATPAAVTIAPGALTATDVQPASMAVGAVGTVSVSATLADPLAADGRIRVTFPGNFSFDVGGATVASSTAAVLDGSLATQTSGQVVTLVRSGGSVVAAGSTISFTLSRVRNPLTPALTTAATGTYTVATLTSALTVVDQDTTVASDTFVANALVGASATPASLVAGSSGTLTVAFTTTNVIPTAGRIAIDLPTGFGTTGAAVTAENLTGSLAVTGAGTQNLVLTRSSGGNDSGSFSITLSNITLPATAGTTGTIVVTTQNSNPFGPVDSVTLAGLVVTAAPLTGPSVTPSSTTAGASLTVDVSFTVVNPLPATGRVVVTFPAGFTFGTVGLTGSSLSGGVTTSRVGQAVIVTRSGDGTSFTSGSGVVSFTLTGIVAPTSAGAAGAYGIATQTSGSVVIDESPAVGGTTFVGVNLSGSATSAMTEADVVAGGRVLVLTVVGDTFNALDGSIRAAIGSGLDGSGASGTGWDALVVPAVVSAGAGAPGMTGTAGAITITLPAVPTFDLAADETVTVTVPASALVGGVARSATSTFTVTASTPATTTTTTTTTVGGGGGGGGGGGSGGGTATTTSTTTTTVAPSTTTTTTPVDEATPSTPAEPTSSGAGSFTLEGDVVVRRPSSPTARFPQVGAAVPADGRGYWTVHANGAVFSFEGAPALGSMAAVKLVRPIVGMAATPTGTGYWLVASDGGVFAFGNATFFGSTGGKRLNQPVVGMAPTPTGKGYWLLASDGGVFSYGDARFQGSTGALRLVRPIVGMAATGSGRGYWLVAGDGGIFAFGDAPFLGSIGGKPLRTSIVGLIPTADGKGYVLVDRLGKAYRFGSAVTKADAPVPLQPAAVVAVEPSSRRRRRR